MFDDIHGSPIPGIEQFRQVVNVDDPAPLSIAEQEGLTGCTAEIAIHSGKDSRDPQSGL